MTVRRIKGKWFVDFRFQHADGRVERVRKRSPVASKAGAEEYERQLRTSMLGPTVRKEVPAFGAFVDDRWWPTYPTAAGNQHTTIKEKRGHLDSHLLPFFSKTRLDAIKQ